VFNGQRRWLLSGGIGSGKSAVRVLLDRSGLETIDADSVGHEVLEPDGAAFGQVAERWPMVVSGGRIDRKALGAIVFDDKGELAALEEITHPHIFGIISHLVQGNDDVVIVEIPLIRPGMKGGWRRIVVDCDDSTRLGRLSERGMASADAEARMRSQPSRSEWLAAADLVVPNHGSREELGSTVAQLSGRL
jgi:dephospho-CoA kinase